MTGFLNSYGADIFTHTLEHAGLSGLALSFAVVLGVPLGVFCARSPAVEKIALPTVGILQTVPSLALFGFLISLPFGGIGARTAVIALSLYALLPIVRNTFTGIRGVSPGVLECARAMGMTPRQILCEVELPLASFVILAGVRVAAVNAVGIATIAAAIGAGGLGALIFRGVAMVDHSLILAGAVPAALMALAFDTLLGLVERRLKRWTGRQDT